MTSTVNNVLNIAGLPSVEEMSTAVKNKATEMVGGEFLEPKIYPPKIDPFDIGGSGTTNLSRGITQYSREEKDSVEEIDPSTVHKQVIEKSLKNEIDINKFYPADSAISQDVITNAQTNYQLKTNNEPYDQKAIDKFNNAFNARLTLNDDLKEGILKGGSFDVRADTNEAITPNPKNFFTGFQKKYPNLAYFTGTTNFDDELNEQASYETKIIKWATGQDDAPTNPDVVTAIARAFKPGVATNISRRLWEIAGGTNEILRFYLPTLVNGLVDTTFGDAQTVLPKDLEEELFKFRTQGIQKFLPDADRGRVINDIVRLELKKSMTEEEFIAAGYAETIDVDGKQVPKVNFVRPSFASKLFEYSIDELNFFEQLAVFMGENIIGGKILTVPFKVAGDAIRGTRRLINKTNGNDLPYNLLSKAEQIKLAKAYASTHNVIPALAAKELALKNRNINWYTKWSASRLGKRVGRQVSVSDSSEKMIGYNTKIKELQHKVETAYLNNEPQRVLDGLHLELKDAYEIRNWTNFKIKGANMINWGLNPKLELSAGLMQMFGRNSFGGPEGEAIGIGAYLLFGGVKSVFKLDYGMDSIPFVGGMIDRKVWQVKAGMEDFGSLFLKDKVFRDALRGYVADPNVRALKELKNKIGLSSGAVTTINKFAKSVSNLEPDQANFIVKNLTDTFDDIDQMTKNLPDGEKQITQELLMTSISEAAGINVFHGLALASDLRGGRLGNWQIKRMTKKVRNKIQVQIDGEKRIQSLSTTITRLDAQIQRLEDSNFAEVDAEAFANMKLTRDMYQSVIENSRKEMNLLVEENGAEASNIIEQLINPQSGLINQYAGRGSGDLLKELFLLKRKANLKAKEFDEFGSTDTVEIYDMDGNVKSKNGVVDTDFNQGVAQDYVDPSTDLTTTGQSSKFARGTMSGTTQARFEGIDGDIDAQEENIIQESTTITNAATAIVDTIVKVANRLKLTQSNEAFVKHANEDILKIVDTVRKHDEVLVQDAYSKISTKKMIPMANATVEIVNLIKNYAAGGSMAQLINPKFQQKLGGHYGSRIVNSLDKGAKRGMISFFDQPEILEVFGTFANKEFENGIDVYEHFVNFMVTDPKVVATITEGSNPSPLQVALYLIEETNIPFDASDFNFLSSPLELEELRQTINSISRTKNEDLKNLALGIRGLLDLDFQKWGNDITPDDYNAIAVARMTHRLNKQKFDKGTFGDKVEQIVETNQFEFVGPEGTKLTSKDAAQLYSPFIKAILSGTDAGMRTAEIEFNRIIRTFGDTTTMMPESMLKMGVDGKYVMKEIDDIKEDVIPVFDIGTEKGRLALTALQGTLKSLLKVAFIEDKGLGKLVSDIKSGAEPNIGELSSQLMQNIPGKLRLPQGVTNVTEFIERIEDLITVNVINSKADGIGQSLKGYSVDGKNYQVSDATTPMPAFSVRDLFANLEQVDNAIMSSKRFKDTHSKFFTKIKTQTEPLIKASFKDLENSYGDWYKRTLLYRNSTTGESFATQILTSGDSKSLDLYVSDLNNMVINGKISELDKQRALKASFVETLNWIGGRHGVTREVPFYDGTKRRVQAYSTPDQAYNLLEGDSKLSKNFSILAKEAGITEDQLDTFKAIFRHGIRLDAENVMKKAKSRSGATTSGPEAGFTISNSLSKAFNVARRMVSTEYVMADIAIRYAALADNVTMNVILNDPKAAKIIKNIITDPTKVLEGDPTYLTNIFVKFMVTDLTRIGLNEDNTYKKQQFWESKGITYQ